MIEYADTTGLKIVKHFVAFNIINDHSQYVIIVTFHTVCDRPIVSVAHFFISINRILLEIENGILCSEIK